MFTISSDKYAACNAVKALFRNVSNSSPCSYEQKTVGLFGFSNMQLKIAGVGFIAGASVGYLAQQALNEVKSTTAFQQRKGITASLLPVVEAAQVFDEGNAFGEAHRSRRLNFIADVVDQAVASVVYIEIQARNHRTGQHITVSNGCGFIVRDDGLILTNAHVVGNERNVAVKLNDGRQLTGRVQYLDPVSDLATVKISAGENLPVMKLGKSADVRAGEWVVAMGSPLTLSNTITAGIVSSTSRGSSELGLHDKNMQYIQTDAAITFGNSGGPLVNLDGEAIGINTMKVTAGISFAIPIDYAKQFLDKVQQLEQEESRKGWFGKISPDRSKVSAARRRYMGITMLTLTPNIVAELHLRDHHFPDVKAGVLVHRIVIGSPAHQGGLEVGDVVIKIDDKHIKSAGDIYKVLETGGKDLIMTVMRGSRVFKITVTPEDVDF